MDLGTLITTRLNIVIEHLSSMLLILANMHEHFRRAGVEPDFQRLVEACSMIIERYADGVPTTRSVGTNPSEDYAIPPVDEGSPMTTGPGTVERKRKKN